MDSLGTADAVGGASPPKEEQVERRWRRRGRDTRSTTGTSRGKSEFPLKNYEIIKKIIQKKGATRSRPTPLGTSSCATATASFATATGGSARRAGRLKCSIVQRHGSHLGQDLSHLSPLLSPIAVNLEKDKRKHCVDHGRIENDL